MPGGLNLAAAARAWGSEAFASTLAAELEALPAKCLPLQEGLVHTSHVAPLPHRVRVIKAWEEGGAVCVRVGVFYAGIVAGCSCADDPTPVEAQPEYCELFIAIDRASGRAAVALRET